jgi:hypothetical protein
VKKKQVRFVSKFLSSATIYLLIMASNVAKAAAIGTAIAMNGGDSNAGAGVAQNGNIEIVPECPVKPLPVYHDPNVCLNKPAHPMHGADVRRAIHDSLQASGHGASLVPNTQTVVCPLEVQSLENPTAVRGFDTVWIVENTSSSPVVVSWVVNGIEYSPFEADINAMDDPKAILKPGEWVSVPTFESFVYHVREIDEDGLAGKIVLQVRMKNVVITSFDGHKSLKFMIHGGSSIVIFFFLSSISSFVNQ